MKRGVGTPCVVKDCPRRKSYKTTGYCLFHQRRADQGVPFDRPFRAQADTFEDRISKSDDGCWEWIGYIDPATGYGRNRQAWAHRVSYERYVGPIPAGLHIDHLCRNHACVRPDHLEPVPPRENWIRGNSPTAIAARNGRCKRDHELTPENTYLRPDGKPGRQCRECIKIRSARRKSRSDAHPFNPPLEDIA